MASMESNISFCKLLLRDLPYVEVSLNPKDVNIVAHRFAKSARNFPSPFCWVKESYQCFVYLPFIIQCLS